jgi:integrase
VRQSELLGLRWRDVDWEAQRIRVRNTFVRSVPMADLVADALRTWRQRSNYTAADDLVFAHPETGRPVDRTKVSRRFKQACSDAGVRVIPFKNLRHTFRDAVGGLRAAAALDPGVPRAR